MIWNKYCFVADWSATRGTADLVLVELYPGGAVYQALRGQPEERLEIEAQCLPRADASITLYTASQNQHTGIRMSQQAPTRPTQSRFCAEAALRTRLDLAREVIILP